jgi:hypothetical protein
MPLVWRIPILALVASVACAQHAKQLARGATRGVKYELAQIDPAIARTLGDQAARGAVTAHSTSSRVCPAARRSTR